VPDYLATIDQGIAGLRIGIDRDDNARKVDPDVVQVTDEAARVLAGLGARLVDVRVPPADEVVRGWTLLCGIETALAHEATFPSRAEEYGPRLRWLIELGRQASALDMARLQVARMNFRGVMAQLFANIDLLLIPTMPTASPTLAQLAAEGTDPDARAARLRFTAPTDLTGQPTITLPGGVTAAGMPIGFQLVADHLGEGVLFRAGHAFQRSTDWHRRRPPV
jgi:amidase